MVERLIYCRRAHGKHSARQVKLAVKVSRELCGFFSRGKCPKIRKNSLRYRRSPSFYLFCQKRPRVPEKKTRVWSIAFDALSGLDVIWFSYLGRCPRLLCFAPLGRNHLDKPGHCHQLLFRGNYFKVTWQFGLKIHALVGGWVSEGN